jgi:hypothetical protein
MQYFVYAIGKKENLIYPYDNCYIGVTKRLEKRWKEHTKSNFSIGKYIRENKLNFIDDMIILCYGTDDFCFQEEKKFRPYPFMGLNEAAGGNGGYTCYDESSKEKRSKSLKGRKITWMHKVVKSRGSYEGKKNPAAKKWLIYNPNNDIFNIEGNLQMFCKEHDLLASCLRYYIGKQVPEISKNTYGGFRSKNEKSSILRQNTTSWKLVLCEE